MHIGIVGYGVIGVATASVFPDTVIYDPAKGYPDPGPLEECSLVFVCVPTPTKGKRQDLSIVRGVLWEISRKLREGQVVAIRSTVLPGSTQNLQEEFGGLIMSANPEFLRSHLSIEDARRPFRIVLGADHPRARNLLVQAYRESLAPDVDQRIILTDILTAEIIKYAANSYLATKISYFNEMYDVCRGLGANYEALRAALVMDPRIARGEETIIDPHSRGFDDECLPKDLEAFITFLLDKGFPATIFQGAAEVNNQVREGSAWEDVTRSDGA